MTREEHISNLQSMINDAADLGLYDKDVESLKCAIEAINVIEKYRMGLQDAFKEGRVLSTEESIAKINTFEEQERAEDQEWGTMEERLATLASEQDPHEYEELVIKISAEEYRWIKGSDKSSFADVASKEYMMYAIKNGTPLPEGHGRIGDLDKLIEAMKERNDDNGGEPLNAVDRGYDLAYQHMVKEAEEFVIIPADKKSK